MYDTLERNLSHFKPLCDEFIKKTYERALMDVILLLKDHREKAPVQTKDGIQYSIDTLMETLATHRDPK
jgi:hypothetical protein